MLDELIDQIPSKGLYAQERRRQAFVYLVSMRPAYKNAAVADAVIGAPWLSNANAFMVFLLVKSMPSRARLAFVRSFGGEKWARIPGEAARGPA